MKETFKTRIKVGNALQIPPRVLIGLGVGAGDRLDFCIAGNGAVVVTKARTPIQKRVDRLRARLRNSCRVTADSA